MSDLQVHVIRDEGLGNAAYLVDLGDGRALAVDVSRDLRAVDAVADARGLRISHAADTHLHADFLTGAVDLARRDGAQVLASAAGGRAYPHHGLRDGDEVDLGGLRLCGLMTPGHTDEHVAFELVDDGRTVGVFTGGSLIVGSAARTDLVDPDRTEELARAQYRSLQRLAGLDPAAQVWPTHGGGSFCSAPTGHEQTSSIAAERATNPLLNAADEDAFVHALLASLGTYPTYFRHLAELNRAGPAPAPAGPAAPAVLAPAELARAVAAGIEIVDVRPVRDFAAGHVPGSVSIPLRPVFASWLGWLVEFDHEVVVVRNPDQDMADVWWQAHKIGYDHLVGQVDDGLASWGAAGRDLTTIPLVTATDMAAGAAEPTDLPAVLDIRQRGEFADGHVPGARNVELGSIPERVAGGDRPAADAARPTVVMCGHGERAMGAASLLARAGHQDLVVLDGGADDWARASGRDLATGGAS